MEAEGSSTKVEIYSIPRSRSTGTREDERKRNRLREAKEDLDLSSDAYHILSPRYGSKVGQTSGVTLETMLANKSLEIRTVGDEEDEDEDEEGGGSSSASSTSNSSNSNTSSRKKKKKAKKKISRRSKTAGPLTRHNKADGEATASKAKEEEQEGENELRKGEEGEETKDKQMQVSRKALKRRNTLSLSKRYKHVNKLVNNKTDHGPLKEGELVWRRSRKENQHVTLSLTPNILWIKKANKDDFSPFLEIININNVFMKKGVETIFPERFPASAEKSHDDGENLNSGRPRGRSVDEQFPDRSLEVEGKEPTEDQKEVEKAQPKPASKFGSMIAGWTARTNIVARPTTDSPRVQPKDYYSFVIEVRRKEFTTNVISYSFSSENRKEIEAWVEAFHEAIIAARLERTKTLRAAKEADSENKGESKEGGEGSSSPRSAEQPTGLTPQTEPTFSRDLHAGLMSVLPGENEKQRMRRMKRELKEELEERKRLGKAEAKLTLFGLVTSKGYPIEEHKVTTPDGYILTVHRIPHSKQETGFSPRPVILLMHGLMDCSVTWIVNETHKSLGFMLADSGFDVWMGNCRGTRFSREHTTLKVDSTQYWQFNRDDLIKDARSTIEHILEHTKQPHLAYVGHSQGTNIMFALLTSQPDMKEKITIFIALAPAVYVHNQKSKMMTYLANMQTDKLFQFMGIKAFLATGNWVNNIAPGFLIYSAQGSRFVTRLIFDSMCGWNPDNNFSLDRLPVIAAHQPGGTSVMVMAHWAQAIRKHKFCKFDYGVKKNQEVYGQEEPPSYNLGSIDNARIAVFYGGEDKLTTKEDVETFVSELPKESVVYLQFEEEYGHLDFVWGDDAHIRVYAKVVLLAKEYHERAEKRREEVKQKAKKADKDGDDTHSDEEDRKPKSKSKKKKNKKNKEKEESPIDRKGSRGEKAGSKKKKQKAHADDLQPECNGDLAPAQPLEQSGTAAETLSEA